MGKRSETDESGGYGFKKGRKEWGEKREEN